MSSEVPPLPQRLQAGKFLAARDRETRALIEALGASGDDAVGVAAHSRHLRRRTTAYKRFGSSARRPNAKKVGSPAELGGGGTEADTAQGDAAPSFQNRAMRRRKARLLESIIAERQQPADGRPVRLETHVWHAKRMAMAACWGCLLPSGATGKGNASRSILHKLREGCLLHDASYWLPLCLHGPLQRLLQLLAAVSDPHTVEALQRDRMFLAGSSEMQLMLHHAGGFPRRAIGPSPICFSPSSVPGKEQVPFLERERQLWLWAHPAAAQELEGALQLASGEYGIQVSNRRGALLRMEVCGRGSPAVLASALSVPEMSWADAAQPGGCFSKDEATWRQWHASGSAERPSSGGEVVQLRVRDPRLARPSALTPHLCIPTADPDSVAGSLLDVAVVDAGRLPTAMSEQQASIARHRVREAELAGAEFRAGVPRQQEECPFVPVAVVRRSQEWWTIVCPRSWGMPLWTALVFAGGHAAGLREWGWISLQCGRPSFPDDFPDTAAARCQEQQLADEDEARLRLRPKGRYAERVAPDWQQLTHSPGSSERRQDESNALPPSTEAAMDVGGPREVSPSSALLPDGCFVARTLAVLESAALPIRQPPQAASQCFVLVVLRFRFAAGTAETGALVLEDNGTPGAVLGYVTTGGIRGLTGRRGPIAVCRGDLLLSTRARQGSRRRTSVRVLVRNSRSPKAHKAEAMIAVEASRR